MNSAASASGDNDKVEEEEIKTIDNKKEDYILGIDEVSEFSPCPRPLLRLLFLLCLSFSLGWKRTCSWVRHAFSVSKNKEEESRKRSKESQSGRKGCA